MSDIKLTYRQFSQLISLVKDDPTLDQKLEEIKSGLSNKALFDLKELSRDDLIRKINQLKVLVDFLKNLVKKGVEKDEPVDYHLLQIKKSYKQFRDWLDECEIHTMKLAQSKKKRIKQI